MKSILRLFSFLALLALAGGGYVFYRLNQPYRGFSEPVFVEFPRGTGTSEMATELAGKGVISERWVFLATRALQRRNLQAGEYRFDHPASAVEVYSRIARGDIFYLELLAPEG